MNRTKFLALAMLLALSCSGCSRRLDKPRVPQTLNTSAPSIMYRVEDYQNDFKEYREAFRNDLDLATRLRDAMINRIRIDIESNYRDYETIIFFNRAKFDVGADFLELGLAFATTVSNGERVKTVLAAVLTGVKGTRLSIDKNFFREKTTETIISKMQANRTEIKNRIVDKMTKLQADKYSFEEAFVDLAEFFHAGTFQAAIVAIANEAGRDAAVANDRTADIEFFRTASLEEVTDLATIRNSFNALFNSWSAVKDDTAKAKPFLDQAKAALTELGQPPKDTDTGDAIFRALNAEITKSRTDRSQLKKLSDAFKKANIKPVE